MEIATLAGGCFWCLVKPFHQWPGVKSVISGYSNGDKPNPTYEEVSTGMTGHVEAVQIEFDPDVMSFNELLEVFFKTFDPTDTGGQFGDRGSHYMPAVFYHNSTQKEVAESVIKDLNNKNIFDGQINTPVLPYKNFYAAEDYHQDFYKKNSAHYNAYYKGSGRKGFIENVWGDNNG